MFYKNKAGQKVGIQMLDLDNNPFTGTVTVYVTGDAGTQAIGSVGSGICTHEGNGAYTYAPSQGETNYDYIMFTFIGTGAAPQTLHIYTANLWDMLLTDINTASSIGQLIKDYLDAAISTRAAASDLTNLLNENKVVCTGPSIVERPASGTKTYSFDFYVNKMFGGVNTPTAITVAAVNEAGTNRNARLDSTTPATVNTGHYRTIYTSTNSDVAPETIILTLSVTNGSAVSKFGHSFLVRYPLFNATQVTELNTVYNDFQSVVLNTDGLATQLNDVEAKVDTVDSIVDSILARLPVLTANGFVKVSIEAVKDTASDATALQDLLQNGWDATNNVIKADLMRVVGAALATNRPGYLPVSRLIKTGTSNHVTSTTKYFTDTITTANYYKGCKFVLTNGTHSFERTVLSSTGDGTYTTLILDDSTILNTDGYTYYVFENTTLSNTIQDNLLTNTNTKLDNIQGAGFLSANDSLKHQSDRSVYYADINFNRDATTDEWTVQWYKNDVPLTSGITSPTITIIKRSDGTNLVNAASMTQVGSTGAYKYDGTSGNRLVVGDTYIIHVAATIDSATRTCRKVTGRDSI